MKTLPTFSTVLDPMSNRLQHNTSTIQPIPLIDDYNPYYPDSDYGFDPYWDANCYNQHHLYFCHNFSKPTEDIELDSPESDNALNHTVANACVDLWQHKCQFTNQPTATEPGLTGYSSCRAFCEHPSHPNRGTGLCTADNQSWSQI